MNFTTALQGVLASILHIECTLVPNKQKCVLTDIHNCCHGLTTLPLPRNVSAIHPSHLSPNPKKRPSVNVPPYAPSLKRQKRSSVHSAASSAHPLRQTSFPPEESAILTGERSPSVDSEVTNITGKGSLATTGGRRRKSKAKGKQPAASVKSGAKEKTVDGRESTGEVPDGDDDEDDEGGDDVVDGVEEEDREAEEKKLA